MERSSLEAWIDYLSLQPRAAQILCQKDNVLVTFLRDTFTKYLRDVKVSYAIPDKREPDFVFYDVTRSVMNVYRYFIQIIYFKILIFLHAIGFHEFNC